MKNLKFLFLTLLCCFFLSNNVIIAGNNNNPVNNKEQYSDQDPQKRANEMVSVYYDGRVEVINITQTSVKGSYLLYLWCMKTGNREANFELYKDAQKKQKIDLNKSCASQGIGNNSAVWAFRK